MSTGTSQKTITARDLARLELGTWATDPGDRGAGRFQARRTLGGVTFYYRFTGSAGTQQRIPIGPYDPDGRSGLTLAKARDKARELTRRYLAGDRDLRDTLAQEADARKAARDAAEVKRTELAAATLGALLTAYVTQLERDGKASAPHVRRALVRHVEKAHPALWSKAAALISTDDLMDLLAPLASPESADESPRLREAAKLRSYLQAAFTAAVRARHDARALPALRALKITNNPARDLTTIEGSTQARDRALSLAELRAYWQRICALPAPWGPLLRVHLLSGGQRVEQLARAGLRDLDRHESTLTLWDTKGRRKEPRRHVVPLLAPALAALDELAPARAGEFLFTASQGAEPASYSGCAAAVREVCAAMAKAEELDAGKGSFTIGDLRRTVETRLAAAGVSVDVRAQLQSHGLGGVQSRFYDRHDWAAEKRAALEKLHELLTGTAATGRNRRARKGAK